MYKLLIVDDERIIRDGIIKSMNWESFEIDVEEAENGVEAYEMMKRNIPDIVITDIKMPGMDGLELIGKAKGRTEFSNIIFVILSGYGEFNFANRAMKYGVKHYLLKPCDEDEITEVLNKVIDELKQNKKKQKFIKKIKDDLDRMMPQVKEQFFRDCVMVRPNDDQDMIYFKNLLKVPDVNMRLLLFHLENKQGYEKRFALKELLDNWEDNHPILSTIIGENILVLQRIVQIDSLFCYLNRVKQRFFEYYQIGFTVAVSSKGLFDQLPTLYNEVVEYLEYQFYLGEGSIITKEDVGIDEKVPQIFLNCGYQRLNLLIRSGNVNEVLKEIESIFSQFGRGKSKLEMIHTSCMELYISIACQGKPENLNEYMERIPELLRIGTLDKMFIFIKAIAQEITECNYRENVQKNSQTIQKVLKVMEDNISDEELSLSGIADKIVYMNVDYLGKLFKKEVGENFSQYLINMRMEKAKQLLLQEGYSKISYIAERVGYGNNPQYFGQVFKRIIGLTPSEYRKSIKN